MGLILDDKDNGVHCEIKPWGAILLTDHGDDSISLDWLQVVEAMELLTEAIKYGIEKGYTGR